MFDHPHHPDPSSTEAPAPPADAPVAAEPSWSAQVEQLLLQAAALCVENDVDPEAFMQAAWAANLDARPGLREHIADAQLMAQVEHLRGRGMVGES